MRGRAKLGRPRCLETTRARTSMEEHLPSVVRERAVTGCGGTSAVCERLSSGAWWNEDLRSGGEWGMHAIGKSWGKGRR